MTSVSFSKNLLLYFIQSCVFHAIINTYYHIRKKEITSTEKNDIGIQIISIYKGIILFLEKKLNINIIFCIVLLLGTSPINLPILLWYVNLQYDKLVTMIQAMLLLYSISRMSEKKVIYSIVAFILTVIISIISVVLQFQNAKIVNS